MALFDFFLSDEKKIAKHHRRLTNRDAQPEDRETSARWLIERGTPESLLSLLGRFDISLDHQIKDKGEKDLVYALAASQGETIDVPLRTWLRQCKHVALPLRLLEELSGRGDAITVVCELLEIERKRDDFKPAKKKALLIWLADVQDASCIDAASPFLEDFDEGVRYAAAEVIIAQKEDGAKSPLERALLNPSEESNRLKVRICEVFANRRWPVSELTEETKTLIPEPYHVKNGILASS